MATATQTMPVGANKELVQQLSDRFIKKEIEDPAYGSGLAEAGSKHIENVGLVTDEVCVATSALEKVKRSYTRKPTGTSKAKKVKLEPVYVEANQNKSHVTAAQSQIEDHMPVQKKKRDRFKGTTEEEVLTRVLPDHIKEDLDILIVGINPGLTAAYVQHHYAGPGNHFWKCLYLSGIIPQPMNALQDAELLNYGIGFTNIVARTTRGSADLTRKEIFEGGQILKEKMLKYLPKIAVFNGKGIYEVFCGHKKFYFGLQPDPFPGCPDTCVFVNPSSSARCTQLPRAVDKVPFYEALKRVRDYIRANGSVEGIDRSTVTFPDFKLVTAPQKVKKEIKAEPAEVNGNSKDEQIPVHNKERAENYNNVSDNTNGMSGNTAGVPKNSSKPRKPRGRPKKEKLLGAAVRSDINTNTSSILPCEAQRQQPPVYTSLSSKNPEANSYVLNSCNIKQEILDGNHPDKDLTAVIHQNINTQQQQSIFQQHHLSMPTTTSMMMPHSLDRANFYPAAAAHMLASAVQSGVKQERGDWAGYGEMPACPTSISTTLASYPQYSCYWNYLPSNGPRFVSNPYPNIPSAPQIAHQQAVAAVSALHTSVNEGQTNGAALASSLPAAYNNPQEASSPAMSSQSNLTQASLDSLPKTDSTSSVVNWLQTIPK